MCWSCHESLRYDRSNRSLSEATPCNPTYLPPDAGTQPYGDLARHIRAALDKHDGGAGWSVVVGKSFGGAVTHRFKKYAALSVQPGVEVLVWRA